MRRSGRELRKTVVVDGFGVQEIGSADFILEFAVFLLINKACTQEIILVVYRFFRVVIVVKFIFRHERKTVQKIIIQFGKRPIRIVNTVGVIVDCHIVAHFQIGQLLVIRGSPKGVTLGKTFIGRQYSVLDVVEQ